MWRNVTETRSRGRVYDSNTNSIPTYGQAEVTINWNERTTSVGYVLGNEAMARMG